MKKKRRHQLAFFSALPVMNTKDVDLSGLKDVILPPTPPIFPLAIGWWVLLLILFFLLCGLAFYIKYRFFPSACVYALRELNSLKVKGLTTVKVGVEISTLLKRVAIFRFGREAVADLSDAEWGAFLKEKGKDIFSQKEIDFIVKSSWMPPKKDVAISLENLYSHTRMWIKSILKEKR